jgi:uncharacterized protein (TIGR04551 family)
MTRPALRLLLASSVLVLVGLGSTPALAQGFGARPGGMGPGGMGRGPEPKKDTPQGPAEAAPEEKEGEPEIPPLPAWPGQETRKLQFFQMRGYFRFRWNMHHNLSNGLLSASGATDPYAPPYSSYNPVSEDVNSSMRCADRRFANDITGSGRGIGQSKCPGSTIGGADMRLRLEPTINVSEHIRIYSQIDIFDNLILGSTPRSLYNQSVVGNVPMAFFSDGQNAPVTGLNTNTPAIIVKRAWAEIDLQTIATLRVGRMPDHWGMGMFANDGNVKADGTCWNCNWGDSQDRIMLTSTLAQHTFAVGYDFSATGPTSLTVSDTNRYYGVSPVDLEKLTNVHQVMWMAGRIDPDEVIQDRVERGELVLNYGLYLKWRKQDFDYKVTTTSGVSTVPGLNSSVNGYATSMIERHAWMLMPDLWFKLLWKKLYIEFEGTLVGGSMGNSSLEQNATSPLKIFQFGLALRSEYRVLKDALRFGFDMGSASGDDDEPLNGDVNRTHWAPVTTKTRGGYMKEFRFNMDYQVDWILFREIVGTVANATYFKPHISYDVLENLGARFDLIYSIANNPVGWPGNGRNIGVELDLEVYYKNVREGFYAGLVYGVLFPQQALARPATIYPVPDSGQELVAGQRQSITGDFNPGAAHTLQGRIFVKF